MRISLHFDCVPVDKLRAVLAACSKARDGFSASNYIGTGPPWMPLVMCGGAELFSVIVPPCDVTTAMFITSEVDG